MKQQQGAQLDAEPVPSPNETSQDGAGRSRNGPAPRMKPQVQEHIGRQLRAVYDDVLKQPLPDRFRELMEKLDNTMGDAE